MFCADVPLAAREVQAHPGRLWSVAVRVGGIVVLIHRGRQRQGRGVVGDGMQSAMSRPTPLPWHSCRAPAPRAAAGSIDSRASVGRRRRGASAWMASTSSHAGYSVDQLAVPYGAAEASPPLDPAPQGAVYLWVLLQVGTLCTW